MLDDYLADVNAGHNIIGSVYIETQAFARPDGPEELRPVGEVEFANGVGCDHEERRLWSLQGGGGHGRIRRHDAWRPGCGNARCVARDCAQSIPRRSPDRACASQRRPSFAF